jgi:hypothetical protein
MRTREAELLEASPHLAPQLAVHPKQRMGPDLLSTPGHDGPSLRQLLPDCPQSVTVRKTSASRTSSTSETLSAFGHMAAGSLTNPGHNARASADRSGGATPGTGKKTVSGTLTAYPSWGRCGPTVEPGRFIGSPRARRPANQGLGGIKRLIRPERRRVPPWEIGAPRRFAKGRSAARSCYSDRVPLGTCTRL